MAGRRGWRAPSPDSRRSRNRTRLGSPVRLSKLASCSSCSCVLARSTVSRSCTITCPLESDSSVVNRTCSCLERACAKRAVASPSLSRNRVPGVFCASSSLTLRPTAGALSRSLATALQARIFPSAAHNSRPSLARSKRASSRPSRDVVGCDGAGAWPGPAIHWAIARHGRLAMRATSVSAGRTLTRGLAG